MPKINEVVGLHPITKRILDTIKGKKSGQIFEVVLPDARQAKRRRESLMRYAKRNKVASIKRIIQKGKILFVEVGSAK